VLGEDWNGVVDEVGEAVVERDGDGAWLSQDLGQRNDGDACCREKIHVAAKGRGRHGDD